MLFLIKNSEAITKQQRKINYYDSKTTTSDSIISGGDKEKKNDQNKKNVIPRRKKKELDTAHEEMLQNIMKLMSLEKRQALHLKYAVYTAAKKRKSKFRWR